VWDLAEDKDAPAPSPHEKAITLHVAKNRSGATGRKLRLAFHGALQRYTDRDADAAAAGGAGGR
jgi:hypothetical protein